MTLQPYQDNSAITFGQEHLDAGDFVPPRVKIIQQMSAESTRDEDRLAPGTLLNTLTGVEYGNRLEFIPLFPFKNRVFILRDEKRSDVETVLGLPLSDGSGLKCRSLDMAHGVGEPGISCEECPLSKWRLGPRKENLPPICSESYNVAAITTENAELVIIQFSKSGAKVGRRMFSMLRMTRAQPWATVYEVTTQRVQNDRGVFFVPDVKSTGRATTDDEKKMALEWVGTLRGIGPIDVTPGEEEPDTEDVAAPF